MKLVPPVPSRMPGMLLLLDKKRTAPKEPAMTVYIGTDFHPYEQTVAYLDDADGVIRYRQFRHSDKAAIKKFYRTGGKDAVIGVEATGSLGWFEKMLFDNQQTLLIGDPRLIRRAALSRHKNDFRDAETILDLLVKDQFPKVEPRSEESRMILQMLGYRHFLVKKRTAVSNQLQAFARQKGLAKFAIKTKTARARLIEAAENEQEKLMLDSRFVLYDEMNRQIASIEAELERSAETDDKVRLLRTHPGIALLTAMALVHTLGDAARFRRKEQVVAFVGLDPLEHSSAEKKRIGHISKHGSRLLRFLLGQAAQTSRDTRVRQQYSRVSRRRGRPIAKVAAARKLLINCYVMLRDGIDYQEFTRRGAKLACAMGQES